MKNFFKFAFAVVLALSVTACGGETPTEDPVIPNDPQQNIQQDGEALGDDPTETPEDPEISEDPAEPSEPEIPEAPAEPETPVEEIPSEPEESPLFDTSWASNEYEKLIPQPPFEGWTGEMKGENVYEISTSQANADGSGAYYEIFQNYLNSLETYGFSIDGEVYSCAGFDEFGNEFEFKCGDGWAWITFYPVENVSGGGSSDSVDPAVDEEPKEEVSFPTFSTDWASNDMEKLIPQPPMVIARSYLDDTGYWVITNCLSDTRTWDQPRFEVTEDVTRVQALEYFDQLKTYGFIERTPMYENKTEIEDAVAVFLLTPDEKYKVDIWHKDDYDLTIRIKAVE